MAIDDESSPYSSQAESEDVSEDDDSINEDEEPTFTTQTVQLDDVSDEGLEFDDGTDDDLEEGLDEESEDDDEDSETPLSQEGGKKKETQVAALSSNNSSEDYETDSDDDDDQEDGLKRFDEEIKKQYLVDVHPESQMPSYEEVRALSKVVRDDSGKPCDPLHRTLPIMSKYERARIIGIRATQIADGAQPLITINKPAISELVIAEMELDANKLPFIIRRPLITGGSEYWKLADLERVI